ncbi:hypothetical protein POX_f08064 [Penicillium oxalicum]|uniref:hypothetical protein n=1 Tax=Penicillium oxalicum TaxID=69781 RepID=UPI0020B65078|nr:hypothetical protein POX_f08064 [Penicillium oxalicum]KAI2787689.1 hypothetical protein POX_f08064 [Penicillium oxalicum]
MYKSTARASRPEGTPSYHVGIKSISIATEPSWSTSNLLSETSVSRRNFDLCALGIYFSVESESGRQDPTLSHQRDDIMGSGILILSTDGEILAIAQVGCTVDQSGPENQEGEYRNRRPWTKEKKTKESLARPRKKMGERKIK